MLENFNKEGIETKNLYSLGPDGLIQLGASSNRAHQLHKDMLQELARRQNLRQTLKVAKCDEIYEKLVETGYMPIEVVSMNHDILKGIELPLLERINVLKKIENVKVAMKGNLLSFGPDE